MSLARTRYMWVPLAQMREIRFSLSSVSQTSSTRRRRIDLGSWISAWSLTQRAKERSSTVCTTTRIHLKDRKSSMFNQGPPSLCATSVMLILQMLRRTLLSSMQRSSDTSWASCREKSHAHILSTSKSCGATSWEASTTWSKFCTTSTCICFKKQVWAKKFLHL